MLVINRVGTGCFQEHRAASKHIAKVGSRRFEEETSETRKTASQVARYSSSLRSQSSLTGRPGTRSSSRNPGTFGETRALAPGRWRPQTARVASSGKQKDHIWNSSP